MTLPIPMLHKLFSVEEYEQMIAAGILTEDDRVELLRGEIVEMAPIGLRHIACVNRLDQLLHEILGRKALVSIQNSIPLTRNSMPQPDVALFKWRDDYYSESRPSAEDVLLLIEVADTSLTSDRVAKVPLYAEAGIHEVWLVNLPEDIIEVYRNPQGGRYSETAAVSRGSSLTIPGGQGASLQVEEILG